MPKPQDMPKLEVLIGHASADKLRASVEKYEDWKKAMERPWYTKGKGSGKATKDIDAAYLKLKDTTVVRMVLLGDNNTLPKLDELIVKWLVKKKDQYELKPEKLKSHTRFHAMLALSDHVDNLLNEMKKLNQDKLVSVNNMVEVTIAIEKTQTELSQAKSTKPDQPVVISSFEAMHHFFAPPGPEKDKSVSPDQPKKPDSLRKK
jgi:hypothetical protein